MTKDGIPIADFKANVSDAESMNCGTCLIFSYNKDNNKISFKICLFSFRMRFGTL